MSTETPVIESRPVVEFSKTTAKLAPAFVRAQRKITHAPKDKENEDFDSKYADLAGTFDACREALFEQGFAITQPVSADGRKVHVCTMLLHESGEWMRSTLTMTATQDNPQAIGSAITYGRRYGLQSMAGIAGADDDGNAASRKPDRIAPPPRDPESRRPPTPAPDTLAAIAPWLERIAAAGAGEESIDTVRAEMNAALTKRTKAQGAALRRALAAAEKTIAERAGTVEQEAQP